MKATFLICLLASSISILFSQPNETLGKTLITSDIDLFWKCYDQAQGKITRSTFQEYIDNGSAGVKGFMHMRIENARKLAKTVKKNQAYYECIRPGSLAIRDSFEQQILQVYQQMKEWYAEATIPNLYFVIGRKNTGGTISGDGLIMGAEMYGPQGNTTGPNAIINYQDIPAIVAHELIHFQQQYSASKTLLDQTLREGSADFLAYLIQGKALRHHLDDWAVPKVEELWGIFEQEMYDKSYQGWLYGGGSVMENAPRDLGYWMGFYICKAYYIKQSDPKQAVIDILTIQDSKAFLEASGFKGEILP
ncbi:MAG: DUF2268 domain-containing putative Zn-dependent protease [Bacteroidota bacterium]